MQTDVHEFTVRDRLGPVKVTGRILADRRFDRLSKPRWTDMALYEVVASDRSPRSTDAFTEGLIRQLTRELSGEKLILSLPEAAQGALNDTVARTLRRMAPAPPVYQYLLEFVARSVVYHRIGGPCVKSSHRITKVGDVRDDEYRWGNLSPCDRRGCYPPDLKDMSDSDQIAEEKDNHHLYLCTSAPDIIKKLYDRNREISGLAAEVLVEAGGKDPRIAQAWRSKRRV
jgi:hypothetical protein